MEFLDENGSRPDATAGLETEKVPGAENESRIRQTYDYVFQYESGAFHERVTRNQESVVRRCRQRTRRGLAIVASGFIRGLSAITRRPQSRRGRRS